MKGEWCVAAVGVSDSCVEAAGVGLSEVSMQCTQVMGEVYLVQWV